MFIPWNSECVRLTGRWSRNEKDFDGENRYPAVSGSYTTATAAGSYFEFAFEGTWAWMHFNRDIPGDPAPHLWVSVDGGAKAEVPIDRYLRVETEKAGNHIVKVLYKGGTEMLPRWYAPLMGAVSFTGFEAEKPGKLPEDDRRIIEFLGDSITEGVLIDCDNSKSIYKEDQLNRPYQDDNSATYAALTAKALNLRAIFQAYGAIGVTRTGCAGVPTANAIYPYVFDGVPYTGEKPDFVVINHGANDVASSSEKYIAKYAELIDTVQKTNPDAIIVCLSAFCGLFDSDLGEFVGQYNKAHEKKIYFISSKGWVPREPLHPLREGHRIIADHLIPLMKEIIG